MSIPAVLPSHQPNGLRKVVVGYSVVQDDESLRGLKYLILNIFPGQFRAQFFSVQIAVQAITAGYVVFSFFNVGLGLISRSETESIFNRETLSDRRQFGLYGLTLLFTFLGTELGFLQRSFGTTSLNGNQWLAGILIASIVMVVDEVIKFFMRRRVVV